ncbi:Uncharacterized protein HZ326_26514 [Fusarium oxysporum f. sp. albedinis]|nr:Uncharacterized protein HZ326_26514 [Fusarium oxysporum f. sp. albedinis]
MDFWMRTQLQFICGYAPLPWLRYLCKHKSQTPQLDLAVGSIVEIVWPPLTGVALVLQSSETSLRGE